MKHGYSIESSRYAGGTRPDRLGAAEPVHARFQGVSVDLDHQSRPLAQIRERISIRFAGCGQGVLAMS
jgi:hypothetical protein